MRHLLDNITWHTLTGPHARFAEGQGAARRYARGFSPILGFEDVAHADFRALEAHCAPGEEFYTDGWHGQAPRGWALKLESTMFKMVWEGAVPQEDETLEAVRLGPAHSAQAVELATLTHPGPFAPRTIELGEYFGVFEGERLIAMAGERMTAGSLREISGVCTHPEYQGRGLARRLMLKLLRRQLARAETPFLHVMSANEVARGLYRRIGFGEYRQSVVRVIERVA
jgi:ribosomal protein S18 acetylase RimI-like enzyme